MPVLLHLHALCLLALLLAATPSSSSRAITNEGQNVTDFGTMKFYWRSYHHGEMCESKPHVYVLEPAPINRCYGADPMSASPHLYNCQLNPTQYRFYLTRTIYKKSDTTCTQTPVEYNDIKHDRICKKDIESGNFLLSRCGPITADLKTDQVIVKSYSNNNCTTSRSIYGAGIAKATLLNRCVPSFPDPALPARDIVSFYHILTFASTNTATKTTYFNDIHYDRADVNCKGAVTYSAIVAFNTTDTGLTTSCKADPFYPGAFYTRVAYVPKAALPSWPVPSWVLYPGP